ncbi:MAG: DUF2059 domain-containing protein [Pseudomonadota bacterium]
MKTGIVAVTIAAAALAFAPVAHADDASRLALARDVVTLMDVSTTVNDMFSQLSPMVAAQAAQEMHLSATEQARLSEILTEEFHNATPQLMDSVAQVYAHNITEEQLGQIRDFLHSPAGHAMIASQGAMQGELEREGQTIGMQVAARALQRLAAERSAAASSTPK